MIISNTMCAQSPQCCLLMVCHDFANLFMAIVLRFFLLNAAFWRIKSHSTSTPHSSTRVWYSGWMPHELHNFKRGRGRNWEAPWTHRLLHLLRGNHRMDAFIQSFSLDGQTTKSRKQTGIQTAIWRGVYSRWVSKWRVSLSIFRTRPNKTGTH